MFKVLPCDPDKVTQETRHQQSPQTHCVTEGSPCRDVYRLGTLSIVTVYSYDFIYGYCKTPMCFNKKAANRLRIVQNAAARLVTGTWKRDHLT